MSSDLLCVECGCCGMVSVAIVQGLSGQQQIELEGSHECL